MMKEKLRSLSLERLLIKAESILRLDIFIRFNFVFNMFHSIALRCNALQCVLIVCRFYTWMMFIFQASLSDLIIKESTALLRIILNQFTHGKSTIGIWFHYGFNRCLSVLSNCASDRSHTKLLNSFRSANVQCAYAYNTRYLGYFSLKRVYCYGKKHPCLNLLAYGNVRFLSVNWTHEDKRFVFIYKFVDIHFHSLSGHSSPFRFDGVKFLLLFFLFIRSLVWCNRIRESVLFRYVRAKILLCQM